MPSRKDPTNPFYVLLVIAGVLFVITACAYGILILRGVMPVTAENSSPSGEGLMKLMDRHGMKIMLGELAVLAVATFGAISTDGYWSRRANIAADNDSSPKHTGTRP